jgi:hypothetical protein
MTVIFAGAFEDCVVVGADQLRHDHYTKEPAGFTCKVRQVNEQVWGAKGGFGPLADPIWEELLQIPNVESLSVDEVAAYVRSRGKVIYEECLAAHVPPGVRNPGLYFVFAGFNSQGQNAVHWLNFQLEDFNSAVGPGKTVAFGPDVSVHDNATDQLRSLVTPSGKYLVAPLDAWAIGVTKYSRGFAPHAIGFPTDLVVIVKGRTAKRRLLQEDSGLDPAFRRRIVQR